MTHETDQALVPAPPVAGWNAVLVAAEEQALAELWLDAAARGWQVTVRPECLAWSVTAPDRVAGAGYDPPGEICTGRVEAYDVDRTLTLTGVDSHGAAIVSIRDFLGWTAMATTGEPA